MLGRADHPDAQTNPLSALYQVAVDFRCSAQGYRDLYLGAGSEPPARVTRRQADERSPLAAP